MSNKIYLVTGAAGFLGGTVCRELVKKGEKVRAFVLPNDKAMQYVPKEAEIIEGDLCDMESLQRFFDVPKDKEIIVLHIASIVTVNPEYNQKVMDVNVGGTENVIALCKKYNVKKLVYCSSTGAIPELPKGTAIKEINHFGTEGLQDCYSQSKALATQKVLDAAGEGLNATVLLALMVIGFLVRGLIPLRAALFLTTNLPAPAMAISSPFLRAAPITSRTTLRPFSASLFEHLPFAAIASINSALFIISPLLN